MPHRVALLIAVVGCSSPPDAVSFSSTEGTGDGTHDCICSYEDGTEDAPSIEITCEAGGDLTDYSFFLDPTISGDQGVGFIFGTSDDEWRGGGTGSFGALGEQRRADNIIARDVSGIEITWPDQVDCDISHGCLDADTMFSLSAGALHAGAGGCEDFEATLDQELSGG